MCSLIYVLHSTLKKSLIDITDFFSYPTILMAPRGEPMWKRGALTTKRTLQSTLKKVITKRVELIDE